MFKISSLEDAPEPDLICDFCSKDLGDLSYATIQGAEPAGDDSVSMPLVPQAICFDCFFRVGLANLAGSTAFIHTIDKRSEIESMFSLLQGIFQDDDDEDESAD